jgi:erythromycin esterase
MSNKQIMHISQRPEGKRYRLIGIGDFTHGIEDIWEFRFDFLKEVMEKTDKNITIFIEDTKEHTDNIMNDDELIFESEYGVSEGKFAYGPLDRYSYRAWDSPIYLEIISYIRSNKDRIQIIGVDAETQARDKEMAQNILSNLHKSNYNFWWAANAHVDSREITESYELKWIPDEKYRCGYYLREELGARYCIVLSTGYKGRVRFSSICDNSDCDNRTFPEIPILEDFVHEPYKKYVTDDNYIMYIRGEFDEPLIEFTDAKFPDGPFVIKNTDWDYLVFFNKVQGLKMIKPNQ